MTLFFPLVLIVLSAGFDLGQALACYSRFANSSSAADGDSIFCPFTDTTCYAYANIHGLHFAGCATCNRTHMHAESSYNMYRECVLCATDYCNSISKSTITCYSQTDTTVCPAGITACYNITATGESGCGKCYETSSSMPVCLNCHTSFCNTQPSIYCYLRSSYASTASVISCATGVTSCFTKSNTGELGCGPCGSSTSCRACSQSNCNSPTYITCYERSASSNSLYGVATTCLSGVTSCYKISSTGQTGCGDCGYFGGSSCTTCSTSYCNIATNVAVKCYYRYRSTSSTKQIVSCSSGKCNSFSYISGGYSFYFNGCGTCSGIPHANCKTCDTDYCNSASHIVSSMSIKIAALAAILSAAVLCAV